MLFQLFEIEYTDNGILKEAVRVGMVYAMIKWALARDIPAFTHK